MNTTGLIKGSIKRFDRLAGKWIIGQHFDIADSFLEKTFYLKLLDLPYGLKLVKSGMF